MDPSEESNTKVPVDPYSVIPLFSCNQWNNKENFTMVLFCVFEKILLLLNLHVGLKLVYQIYIYRTHLRIPLGDKRYMILILSLASALFSFGHTGLMTRIVKEQTQILFALFSFLIYFIICYYYSYKATNYLKNKKAILKFLKALFIIGLTLMVGISITLFVMIELGYNHEN